MPVVSDFFEEIDRRWRGAPSNKIPLLVLGSAALLLQTDYERGTKDSDVLETGFPLDDLNASLHHFEVHVLDVVDVVVSKLKPFRPSDRGDIKAMIDRKLVPHDRLVERFRDAVDDFAGGAGAEDLPRCIKNLNRIERDLFNVPESQIELPDWLVDRL